LKPSPHALQQACYNALILPELIAHSLQEYEQKALRFAQNPEMLALIKQKLIWKSKNPHYSSPNSL